MDCFCSDQHGGLQRIRKFQFLSVELKYVPAMKPIHCRPDRAHSILPPLDRPSDMWRRLSLNPSLRIPEPKRLHENIFCGLQSTVHVGDAQDGDVCAPESEPLSASLFCSSCLCMAVLHVVNVPVEEQHPGLTLYAGCGRTGHVWMVSRLEGVDAYPSFLLRGPRALRFGSSTALWVTG